MTSPEGLYRRPCLENLYLRRALEKIPQNLCDHGSQLETTMYSHHSSLR